jgi:DNA-binding response OmpR family regulator
MNVLIAEDDPHIRAGLTEILAAEGYTVQAAADGAEALMSFAGQRPDFVILDIMMPLVDGYEVCRRIRRTDPDVPIVFLSARSEEIDRVLGLELGADDFINKPFGVREIVARIRAVTRRCLRTARSDENQPFELGPLTVLPAELRAEREGQTVDLSLRDVQILRLLLRERGRVVDRDQFFRECWGYDHLPNSRTLDQHISKLRKRIEPDPRNPSIIRTVHGVGYRFEG